MKLRTNGVDDGADQEGTEKSLCHCGERVDAVAFGGDLDVLAFQKCCQFFHTSS